MSADTSGANADLRLLIDGLEMLLRQVHPKCVTAGVPTSLAFRPSPKRDQGELSVTLGSLTTPAEAFEHHTLSRHMESAGTWGLLVDDLTDHRVTVAAGRSMQAYAQAFEDDPAHGFVDFRGMARGRCDAAGTILRTLALGHGCLYEPQQTQSS